MVKITSFVVAFGVGPLNCFFELPTTKNNIPYESLYEIQDLNKSTMEYNYIRMEDFVKEQNQKLLEKLFLDRIINEDTR
jgi:hypothetical protein